MSTQIEENDAQAEADRESLKAQLGAEGGAKLGTAPTIAPIGGQFISSIGGMVGFCPCGGNAGAIGTPNQVVEFTGQNPPTSLQTNYLDVASWRREQIPFFDDTTNTGSWGQGMDLALSGNRFIVDLINDYRYTPQMLAKYGLIQPTLAATVSFNLGCRMTLLQGNPANYPAPDGAFVPDFYYCPSVKLANPGDVIDAMGKKMMRCRMELVANAPLFHMPYEKNLLTAFLTHLTNRYLGF